MSNNFHIKNQNNKTLESIKKLFSKKMIAIFPFIFATGALSPIVYDIAKDAYIENDLLRQNEVIEYTYNNKKTNTQKYMEKNLETYNKLKDLCEAYRDLQLEKDPTKLQKCLLPVAKNDMIKDLESFVDLALYAAKAKIGDAFGITSDNLKIIPDLKDSYYYVTNNNKNIYFSSFNNDLELTTLIKRLSNLQFHKVDGPYDETKTANNLYALFNSTTKVLNNEYMLAENNKLIEVPLEKNKNINKPEKSEDLEK